MTPTGISNHRVERAKELFNHRWPVFVGGEPGSSSRGVTLAASNYEWPFELIIPGDTPECIEGLDDSYIVYNIKATVARGRLAYDLHAYKSVRIIRTLDPAALELAHAMTVENVWPNKIEYSLCIPQKAIIFGTSIAVDMKFTSLLKGLKIGACRCQLVEILDLTLPGIGNTERTHKKIRDIESWNLEVDEERHYHDMINEAGQDGYILKELLALPKSLKKCMQDCETHGIKIRHKVKFNIALHNPDGHTSEVSISKFSAVISRILSNIRQLRATLPVTIFISPNVPLDEAGNLLDQTPNHVYSLDVESHAPPLYGEHILDQLYADIDNTGYLTPAASSGINTPFYSHSRQGSSENLAASNAETTDEATAEALSNRLSNLGSLPTNHSYSQMPRQGNSHMRYNSSTPRLETSRPASSYFDPSHSNPLSRRTSSEDAPNGTNSRLPSGHASILNSGQHTPEHLDFADLGLNKVPSYTTAIKAPVRNMSYLGIGSLPLYDVAVSVPPSPTSAMSYPSPQSPPPDSSDARDVSESPPIEMHIQPRRHHNPITHLGFTAMTGRRANIAQDDEARRVHLMQARGRAH
jgi:hypothetical protein